MERLRGLALRVAVLRGRTMRSARRVGLAWIVTTLAACGAGETTELVVRTDLPGPLLDYVEVSFEEANPGVDVRFTRAGAMASLDELAAWTAGAASGRPASAAVAGPPFDVWWGAPATTLERASDAGLLTPYRPPWVDQPGVGRPRADGRFDVTLVTPFVVAFNRDSIPLPRAPADWIDLLHFRWTGEVVALHPVRTSQGGYFLSSMLVQALREDGEVAPGFDWLRRFEPQIARWVDSSTEAVRMLRSGEALIGVLPRADVEAARADGAPWLHYRMPESGTPMLALGVGIVEGARASEAARRFVDHLGTRPVATETKLLTRWQPAHGDVDMARYSPDFEIDMRWTPYPLALDTLARDADGWISRWDLDIRGR